MRIFWLVLKLGFELYIFVTASLVHVYTRFRALSYALKLFDDMLVRDMVSWNAMIFGSCQNGNATEALDVLNKMRLEGIMMDLITIIGVGVVSVQCFDQNKALVSFYNMQLIEISPDYLVLLLLLNK
ncbi:hypothetical protein Gotri_009646, partial [Gossypium trilobum]|nr:hypothetical protein [Gossypium trilobum]